MAYNNQLTSLTLPDGAGPGEPRIELNGDDGSITLIGANEDDRMILSPNAGLDNDPYINVQHNNNPGDAQSGFGHSFTGPVVIGEEFVSSWNSNDSRAAMKLQHFLAELGVYNSVLGARNGGSLSATDFDAELGLSNNGTQLGSVRVTNGTLTGGIILDCQDLPRPDVNILGGTYRMNFVAQAHGFVAEASSTADTAAIGAEAVVLTLPSITWVSGRAYEIISHGRAHKGSIGHGIFRLRRTNLAGAVLSTIGAIGCPEINVDYQYNHRIVVARTAGTDLSQVVVLTLAAGAGTIINDGSGDHPRYIEVRDIGEAADHAHAIAI